MKGIFGLQVILFISLSSYAQSIVYSASEHEYLSQVNNHIIGKLDDHILIYKTTERSADIVVYDKNMNVVGSSSVGFLKKLNLLEISFVSTPDYCYAVLQTFEGNMVYCKTAEIDDSGKVSEKMQTVDSTSLAIVKGNKLYSIAQSENKKYVLLHRVVSGLQPDKLQLDQIVLDEKANIKRNDHYFIPSYPGEMVSSPEIDDYANIVFMKIGNNLLSQKSRLSFYISALQQSDLIIKEFEMNNHYFQFPVVKVDNFNKIYHIVSLYKSYATYNTEGILLLKIGSDISIDFQPTLYPFSRSLKLDADKDEKPDAAFNNYYLKDCFIKKDGGISVSLTLTKMESGYRTLGTPPPPVFVSPQLSTRGKNNLVYRYFNSITDVQQQTNQIVRTTYIDSKHNIMIFSFDKDDHFLKFANPKVYPTPDFIPYYLIMNLPDQAVFVYNEKDKKARKVLLNNFSLQPDGVVTMNPIFRNLDKGYNFFPEAGKQVDATTLIVPCEHRGKLAFAKIIFNE